MRAQEDTNTRGRLQMKSSRALEAQVFGFRVIRRARMWPERGQFCDGQRRNCLYIETFSGMTWGRKAAALAVELELFRKKTHMKVLMQPRTLLRLLSPPPPLAT